MRQKGKERRALINAVLLSFTLFLIFQSVFPEESRTPGEALFYLPKILRFQTVGPQAPSQSPQITLYQIKNRAPFWPSHSIQSFMIKVKANRIHLTVQRLMMEGRKILNFSQTRLMSLWFSGRRETEGRENYFLKQLTTKMKNWNIWRINEPRKQQAFY